MEQNPSSSTTDRKTIEKNRRNHMKALVSKLDSLVPRHSSKETMSLPDQLEEAANYIKRLEKELEKMREKKDSLLMGVHDQKTTNARTSTRIPEIEVHEMGSTLEVVFITGSDFHFMFNETIRVLREEGVEVVHASFSVLDDVIFHTIHSKVGESGVEGGAARITERLKKFVCDANL